MLAAGIGGGLALGVMLGLLVGLTVGAWTKDSRRGAKAGLITAAVPTGIMAALGVIGMLV